YTGIDDPFGTGAFGGAKASGSNTDESTLWGSQTELDKYDMILFPCQGQPPFRDAATTQRIVNYTNAGGRVFATHYSYTYLWDVAPFSSTADWDVDQSALYFTNDPEVGYIDMTFPKGLLLAQWLVVVNPGSVLGQIPIGTLRHDFDGVFA